MIRSVRALLVLLGLLLALAPRVARAESDVLKNARNTFEYGNYDEARRLSEALLATSQLADQRDLVEAYRIAGLSNFYLNRTEAARRHFVALLSVNPDYSMDPFLVPPAAVAFFDGVKRDNESLLAPIRERRKALAEQERLADEARRRLIEENLMRQIEPERPVLVQRVETHPFITNLVPFGVGQFQEGRPEWGVAFAGTQILGLTTAVFCFTRIESLRNRFGTFDGPDYGTAKNLDKAKWAGLGLFALSAGYGIFDSIRHFEPTVTRVEPLQQPASRPLPPPASGKSSAPPPSAAAPSPHAALTLQPQLFPVAGPDLLGLGLSLRF